jgi:LPXTG-motif cell wall-anchored protein
MNQDNAIQIALDFTKKWEQLASSSPNKTSYFKNTSSLDGNTTIYPYPDGKSYSIGWGTYNVLSNGTKITKGTTITKSDADREIEAEMRRIDNIIFSKITRDLTDNEYAAILDYSYNAGAYSLSKNYPNILQAINDGADISALKSAAITDSRTGNVSSNLKNRRLDEISLYNSNYSPTYSYYLRNETTINYALIGLILVVTFGGYLYFKRKKNA